MPIGVPFCRGIGDQSSGGVREGYRVGRGDELVDGGLGAGEDASGESGLCNAGGRVAGKSVPDFEHGYWIAKRLVLAVSFKAVYSALEADVPRVI